MNEQVKKDVLVTKEARKEIKDLVLAELENCQIHSLPIGVKSIIKTHENWILLTSQKAYERGLIEKPYYDFTGCHIWHKDKCFIIYNERHNMARQRWTITHEIGHILRKHLQCGPVEEAEANYFTKQLLAPIAVLASMNAITKEQIMKACDISEEAAKIRVKDLDRHYKFKEKYGLTEHDVKFLRQFGRTEFGNELFPYIS